LFVVVVVVVVVVCVNVHFVFDTKFFVCSSLFLVVIFCN